MSNNDDTSRAYTPEEMRQIMLLYFRTMVRYWATLKISPEDLAKMNESDIEYRLSGLVFSMLNVFDGTANGLPAFDIRPVPHPDDQADAVQNGRNWFECVTINDCMLHDEWHKTK